MKGFEMENHLIDATMQATQATIAARVEAIRQAHANNLIEGLDMGTDVFEAMLQRASEPISNEEFTRREEALWLLRHQVVTTTSKLSTSCACRWKTTNRT